MYMNSEVFDKVKEILIENFFVDEEKITESASFLDDFGLDSLMCMELLLQAEEVFNVKIDPEDVSKVVKVSDAVKLISDKIGE